MHHKNDVTEVIIHIIHIIIYYAQTKLSKVLQGGPGGSLGLTYNAARIVKWRDDLNKYY